MVEDEDPYGIEMSDEQIAVFLGEQGHGVLSFGGETPYGIPISFGYDVLNNRCIFQLVFNPESKKQAYIEESSKAHLVVYDRESPDVWRSVLIDGELNEIDQDTPDAIDAAGVFASYASTVGLAAFNKTVDELSPVWYELRIEEMTGHRAPVDE